MANVIAVAVEGDLPEEFAQFEILAAVDVGELFSLPRMRNAFKKLFFIVEDDNATASARLVLSKEIPIALKTFNVMHWWSAPFFLFNECVYKSDRPGYSNQELTLLILDCEDKERQVFERLKNKFSLSKEEIKHAREGIPENVRVAVWRRDEGKCVKCNSRTKLEYDHIIPVSKGGSNTARNIELLCEACNRAKRDNIG